MGPQAASAFTMNLNSRDTTSFPLKDLAECSLMVFMVQTPSHLPRPRRVQSRVKASKKVPGFMGVLMVSEPVVPGPQPL